MGNGKKQQKEGFECIACGEKKRGNTEPGMICALCHLERGITTKDEADAFRMALRCGQD